MKHGLLEALRLLAPRLPRMGAVAAASLLLASIPHAFAGIFSASKNDVAVKVATLSERYSDVPVWALDFSPDGKYLVAGSDTQNINVWNWRTERIKNTIIKPDGSNNGVASNPIAYSPDGHLLAVCLGKGEGDAVIRIWNTESWSIATDVIDHGPGGCEAVTFTPCANVT